MKKIVNLSKKIEVIKKNQMGISEPKLTAEINNLLNGLNSSVEMTEDINLRIE